MYALTMMNMERLAALAGVSTATVSRALRGDPRTAAATRERILKLAQAHGYTPDPTSQRLAERRWKLSDAPENIGLLIFAPGEGNESVALEHARSILERRGYGVTRLLWSSYPRPERLTSVIRARGIHALILGEVPRPDLRVELPLTGCVAVACGFSYPGLSIHTVASHPFQAVRLALNELRLRGARRPACALLRDRRGLSQTDVQRLASARFELRDEPPGAIYEGGFDDPAGVIQWLQEYRPDAVSSLDQVYWWIQDAGFRVPEQIAFASFQKSEQIPHPEISGVCIHQDLIGAKTVECLLDLMRSHSYGETPHPIYHHIAPTWHEGQTTGPRLPPIYG